MPLLSVDVLVLDLAAVAADARVVARRRHGAGLRAALAPRYGVGARFDHLLDFRARIHAVVVGLLIGHGHIISGGVVPGVVEGIPGDGWSKSGPGGLISGAGVVLGVGLDGDGVSGGGWVAMILLLRFVQRTAPAPGCARASPSPIGPALTAGPNMRAWRNW